MHQGPKHGVFQFEEQASETRQEKRMEKETGNASVVPKIAVGLAD